MQVDQYRLKDQNKIRCLHPHVRSIEHNNHRPSPVCKGLWVMLHRLEAEMQVSSFELAMESVPDEGGPRSRVARPGSKTPLTRSRMTNLRLSGCRM